MRGAAAMPGLEFPVFLVTGMIPFLLFQNLSNRLMDAVEANRGLFAYRQVKPLDTLVSRAMVEALMNLARERTSRSQPKSTSAQHTRRCRNSRLRTASTPTNGGWKWTR